MRHFIRETNVELEKKGTFFMGTFLTFFLCDAIVEVYTNPWRHSRNWTEKADFSVKRQKFASPFSLNYLL